MDEEMAQEYLLKEYELCFEQLRYYDTRQESILKYTITLASAIATAQFAIYKLPQGTMAGFFLCMAVLSGLAFIATLLLFLAMLQNRLYFVFVARQLNAIRGYLMEVEAQGFKNNQMYTSTNFPALKPLSVHTFILLGVALISSLFAGAAASAIPATLCGRVGTGIGVASFSLVGEVTFGITYLYLYGRKSADEAVHRTSRQSQPNS